MWTGNWTRRDRKTDRSNQFHAQEQRVSDIPVFPKYNARGLVEQGCMPVQQLPITPLHYSPLSTLSEDFNSAPASANRIFRNCKYYKLIHFARVVPFKLPGLVHKHYPKEFLRPISPKYSKYTLLGNSKGKSIPKLSYQSSPISFQIVF